MTQQAPPPDPRPAERRRRRSPWLQPSGISAIAGVLAVLITAIGLLITREPAPSTAPAGPSSGSPAVPAIFVYGSSMPGQSRYGAVEQFVTATRRDSVDGLLYDSGLGYPMAKFGTGGEIPGFVLTLDPATANDYLREQTRLEAGLFHPREVRTRGGITATAYEWIGATDGFPRIPRWDGSTAHYGATVKVLDLSVGDCFQPASSSDLVMTMWCDAPHISEVFHTATVPEDDDDPQSTADKLCRSAFPDFVGIPADDSSLSVTAFVADADAVAAGEGAVVCALSQSDHTTTGSLKDSRR